MKFWVLLGCLVVANWSCNDDHQVDSTESVQAVESKKRGTDIEPLLKSADSMEILFYDDPQGDSLRYSRYFTYSTSGDTSEINLLVRQFDQPFEEWQQVKNCRSEGKIHLLRNKEPVKTIYFSTAKDSCSYLYFIKNGNMYYFGISDHARSFLSKYEKQAKKPL